MLYRLTGLNSEKTQVFPGIKGEISNLREMLLIRVDTSGMTTEMFEVIKQEVTNAFAQDEDQTVVIVDQAVEFLEIEEVKETND